MSQLSQAAVERLFGRLNATEALGGRVTPSVAWRRRNLTMIRLPYLADDGHLEAGVWCHNLVAPLLKLAFDELKEKGLLHLVQTVDGCYVPRHVLWDSTKPLSRHSWGIALDLNARLYRYGSGKEQDDRLVEVMAAHGFGYGGGGPHALWRIARDPMHFEVADAGAVRC